jgi:prepilin-type N-terminal cleavage/methylation domain-containing protein
MQHINRRTGITLIEIMVVLAILVALASIVVPRYEGLTRQSQITATQEQLRQLQSLIVNRYVNDMSDVVTSTNAAVAKGLPGPHAGNLFPTTRQQWPQLSFLFVNPVTNDMTHTYSVTASRGWRGPYLLSGRGGDYPGHEPSTAIARGFDNQYGITAAESTTGVADQTVLDTWGNPVVIQYDNDFAVLNTSPTISPVAYYMLVSAGPDGTLGNSDDITMPLR